MEIFMQTDEYMKANNFASVQPCDSKTKIRHCIKEKYADSTLCPNEKWTPKQITMSQ